MVTAEHVADHDGDTIEVFRNAGDAVVIQICEHGVYASVTLTDDRMEHLIALLHRVHDRRKA